MPVRAQDAVTAASKANEIMNDRSAGYAELPRTAYLDHTLRRARNAAEQRSHRYVTLDHLLLALLDDPDAGKLLQAVGADVAVIQSTIANTVNNKMAALVDPSGRPPSFSYKFDTIFAGASEDAMRAGRRHIDGALALIAVAKDPECIASAILAGNGFPVPAALNALGAASAPQPSYSPSQTSLPPPPRNEMALTSKPEPQRRAHNRPAGADSSLVRTPARTSLRICWRRFAISSMRRSVRLPRSALPLPCSHLRPGEASRALSPNCGPRWIASAVLWSFAAARLLLKAKSESIPHPAFSRRRVQRFLSQNGGERP